MAKTLVIAEKPSLGRSIASGLTWWKNEPVSYTHLRAHETPEHLV